MKSTFRLLAVTLILALQILGAEDIKLAQTGFQFLSVTSDARAAGMAEAMTTIKGSSAALFFNPATMARSDALAEASFSQNEWFADITHVTASVSLSPRNGYYGVFAFSLQSVDYGEVEGTMVWPNDQGYVDTEIFNPSALCLGFGYAKALSDKFSVGGHVKSAHQYLGKSVIPVTDTTLTTVKNNLSTLAYDFGTIYETGWKDFAFGMSVRNFSGEIKYQSEGFQPPLTFTLGMSIDVSQFALLGILKSPLNRDSKFVVSIDALHLRSAPEKLNIGMEYNPISLLYLRAGYLYNYDEPGITYGIGLVKSILSVDYAAVPFGRFDMVQKISVQIIL